MPYLDTRTMIRSTERQLENEYSLEFVGREPTIAQPGDLLVYRGHVVLLEKNHGDGTGDIIHATGSRDINGSGQGIQRARFVNIGVFRGRGPLQKILRHQKMAFEPWREHLAEESDNSAQNNSRSPDINRPARWVPDDLEL